ncbi:MAG: hypothetical protein LBL13_06770, partial [Bacteroidales bacterium]|nr:hypothetical protein [Bacteroidales bacterium]
MTKKNKKREETGHSSIHSSNSLLIRLKDIYYNQQRVINVVTVGVLVCVIAILAYILYYIPRQQDKAELAIYKAEQYFAMDS